MMSSAVEAEGLCLSRGGRRVLEGIDWEVACGTVLRQELWAPFAEMAAGGTTLLISSHAMDEAQRCDALLLLRDGKVVSSGRSPDQLCEETGTSTVEQAFLTLVGAST